MKRNTKIVMSLVVSLVLTLLTLFIPISVQTREEMTAVKHGFPLSFVSQDISMLDWGRGAESPTLPQKTGLLSPQKYPYADSLDRNRCRGGKRCCLPGFE